MAEIVKSKDIVLISVSAVIGASASKIMFESMPLPPIEIVVRGLVGSAILGGIIGFFINLLNRK